MQLFEVNSRHTAHLFKIDYLYFMYFISYKTSLAASKLDNKCEKRSPRGLDGHPMKFKLV